jgi:threonine synthase
MVIYIWCYLVRVEVWFQYRHLPLLSLTTRVQRMAEDRTWEYPDDLSTIQKDHCIDVVLPTGAMGNVTAAFLTKRMGLPIGKLYMAVNANDITDRVIRTGDFRKSSRMIRTQSEAINIQVPYNFERILYYVTNGDAEYVRSFYEEQPEDARTLAPNVHQALIETFGSVSISDEEMQDALRHTYEKHQYLCDPHTAVALAAVEKLQLLQVVPPPVTPLVVMATASPCKFQHAVTAAVGPDAWNAYAASEPALNGNNHEEVPPQIYPKVEGASLEETQAHWQTLLKDVLEKLEAPKAN